MSLRAGYLKRKTKLITFSHTHQEKKGGSIIKIKREEDITDITEV